MSETTDPFENNETMIAAMEVPTEVETSETPVAEPVETPKVPAVETPVETPATPEIPAETTPTDITGFATQFAPMPETQAIQLRAEIAEAKVGMVFQHPLLHEMWEKISKGEDLSGMAHHFVRTDHVAEMKSDPKTFFAGILRAEDTTITQDEIDEEWEKTSNGAETFTELTYTTKKFLENEAKARAEAQGKQMASTSQPDPAIVEAYKKDLEQLNNWSKDLVGSKMGKEEGAQYTITDADITTANAMFDAFASGTHPAFYTKTGAYTPLLKHIFLTAASFDMAMSTGVKAAINKGAIKQLDSAVNATPRKSTSTQPTQVTNQNPKDALEMDMVDTLNAKVDSY